MIPDGAVDSAPRRRVVRRGDLGDLLVAHVAWMTVMYAEVAERKHRLGAGLEGGDEFCSVLPLGCSRNVLADIQVGSLEQRECPSVATERKAIPLIKTRTISQGVKGK